jgi:hypothetical protein
MLVVELVHLLIGKKLQIAAGLILVLVHAYFFLNFSNDYRYAGRIVRETLDCMLRVEGPAKAFVADVPSQYRGALIFRSGLPEAVQWYNGQKCSVNILSLKEIEHAQRLHCEKVNPSFGREVEIIIFSIHP